MKYKNKELISQNDFQNNIEKHLDYLAKDPFNRLVIVRDGKKAVVIMPICEYEHIRAVADAIEAMHIAKIIDDRKGLRNLQTQDTKPIFKH